MSCGGCGCCPKCGCRATCTCNRNISFQESGSDDDFSYIGMVTVAGETGKCGNCNCSAGICARETSNQTFYVAAENGGNEAAASLGSSSSWSWNGCSTADSNLAGNENV